MRSNKMKAGLEKGPHRSLFHALGLTREEIDKPMVGVVNSANEVVPGHVHLHSITSAVKSGIRMSGGVPIEFPSIAVCDGIAMNHEGMRMSLPSRELTADSIELMATAHPFDALVCVTNCDKCVPGMLMAMLRLNIPAIIISGGPMMAGRHQGRAVDLIKVFETVGMVKKGLASEDDLAEMELTACPGCGSCAGMFTANSMNCLSEAIGLALPGNGTIPAVSADRIRLAKMAGTTVMQLFENDIKPRDIVDKHSVINAVSVDMALGCSTNTVLHLPAIFAEAGLDLDLTVFDRISQQTPNLCRLAPAGPHHIEDLHRAGGIPAVMTELARKNTLNLEVMTVTGKSLQDNLTEMKSGVLDYTVIKDIDDPYAHQGGIAILTGNLAPEGSVVKQSAVDPAMMSSEGRARVFESEEDAAQAILNHQIKAGDVVVVRYEGPKGGPGMREMLTPTSVIAGMGLDTEVALITDGRFSGGSRGAAVGHISPEAAEGGLIGLLQDGDRILIDIPNRKIEAQLTEEEIEKRKKDWKPVQKEVKSPLLRRYAALVSSAAKGAVFVK